MKKNILFIFAAALTLVINFQAARATEREGLPDENNLFWNVMSSMTSPNDTANCVPAATAIFEGEGMPAGEAAAEAASICNELSQMDDQMSADMSLEGVETNLFSASNWHSVEDLYFQRTGYGKIEFSADIDFMSYDFMQFMENFRNAMEMGRGVIGLDSDLVDDFKSLGATLTMYNVPHYDEPEILVDGGRDDDGIVSNFVYDQNSKTVTFVAVHFTTFELSGGGDEEPRISTVKARKYFDAQSNKWKVKLIIKGKHFNKNTKVRLGGKSAYKVKYKNSKRISARFSLSKLQGANSNELQLKVINGDESKKFKRKLMLSSLANNFDEI